MVLSHWNIPTIEFSPFFWVWKLESCILVDLDGPEQGRTAASIKPHWGFWGLDFRYVDFFHWWCIRSAWNMQPPRNLARNVCVETMSKFHFFIFFIFMDLQPCDPCGLPDGLIDEGQNFLSLVLGQVLTDMWHCETNLGVKIRHLCAAMNFWNWKPLSLSDITGFFLYHCHCGPWSAVRRRLQLRRESRETLWCAWHILGEPHMSALLESSWYMIWQCDKMTPWWQFLFPNHSFKIHENHFDDFDSLNLSQFHWLTCQALFYATSSGAHPASADCRVSYAHVFKGFHGTCIGFAWETWVVKGVLDHRFD